MPLPFQRRPGAQLRPSFSRDFAGLNTLDHGVGPPITFTRASGATFFDAAGTLQTAGNNAPRFDHDPASGASRGLLIEEARTNSIRNSQAGGSTNGVIGSGGVLPTNYTTGNLNVSGLTNEVIGTGTESGISYFDYKISGTPTATSQGFINFELSSEISALSGQTWTSSAHIKLQAGSLTNVASVALTIFERDSSDGNLATSFQAFTPTSAALSTQRQSLTRVLNNASTARLLVSARIGYTNGSAFDVTLRIGAPQAELGAFPTSYIPTTTAAATRSADSAVVTPIASFYNQSEGTLFGEAQYLNTDASLISVDDGTGDNRMVAFIRKASTTALPALVRSSASDQSAFSNQAYATGFSRVILAYKANDLATTVNGLTVQTDTSATIPAVTTMRFGSNMNPAFMNGHIRKLAYFPKRLTNTLLQQLTT